MGAQELANMGWAFATTRFSDALIFSALAMVVNRCVDGFNAQELANMAWAFAMVGEPAPALLDPISMLDAVEALGTKLQVVDYRMSMQGLSVASQIETGFALLARAEGS